MTQHGEAFCKVPGAESFCASIKRLESTMPTGTMVGDHVICTPVLGGTAVDFGLEGEKPLLYGGFAFEKYFERAA